MTNEEFLEKYKELIYKPYTEAWTIMKFLRDGDLSKNETWDKYVAMCDDFIAKYPNELGHSLNSVLIDNSIMCGKLFRDEM